MELKDKVKKNMEEGWKEWREWCLFVDKVGTDMKYENARVLFKLSKMIRL